MKDRYGVEIEIGDIVCTNLVASHNGIHSGVILGLVTGFTPKMVKVNNGFFNSDLKHGFRGQSYESRNIDPFCVVVFQKGNVKQESEKTEEK